MLQRSNSVKLTQSVQIQGPEKSVWRRINLEIVLEIVGSVFVYISNFYFTRIRKLSHCQTGSFSLIMLIAMGWFDFGSLRCLAWRIKVESKLFTLKSLYIQYVKANMGIHKFIITLFSCADLESFSSGEGVRNIILFARVCLFR